MTPWSTRDPLRSLLVNPVTGRNHLGRVCARLIMSTVTRHVKTNDHRRHHQPHWRNILSDTGKYWVRISTLVYTGFEFQHWYILGSNFNTGIYWVRISTLVIYWVRISTLVIYWVRISTLVIYWVRISTLVYTGFEFHSKISRKILNQFIRFFSGIMVKFNCAIRLLNTLVTSTGLFH